MGDVVRRELDGAVGRLTLDRPAKLNALSRSVLEGLIEAAAWFDAQPGVKVVVVAGAGRAFSAGFDLSDPTWADLGPPEQSAVVGRAMAAAISGMRAITVASVQGHCVGGGVVLAASCDLRVAAADARFRIPEVDLGVPLYWTGIPRLVRELGPALTTELVLTGRAFDAEEARAIRFVNRVVPLDQLRAATDDLAGGLAEKPAVVLEATKAQVEAAAPALGAHDPGVDDDLAGFARALRDPEARAVAARRPPPGRS